MREWKGSDAALQPKNELRHGKTFGEVAANLDEL
jgi:hypothetical protein